MSIRIPTMSANVERRLLINYRLDPAVAETLLPSGLRPQLVGGSAVTGICLLRLGAVRLGARDAERSDHPECAGAVSRAGSGGILAFCFSGSSPPPQAPLLASYPQEVLVRAHIVGGNVGGCCDTLVMSTQTATHPDISVGADLEVESMSDAALLDALDHGFEQKHVADSRLVRLAAEVVHRSRSTLGPDGLATRLGGTSAAMVLAEVGRITVAEGQRLCRVAEATSDRLTLVGERMPAAYPLVADAIRAALIPIDSANLIVSALSQASPRAEQQHLDAAELALVRFAIENPADSVRKLAARWRDALDTDGIEPREDELVERRSLRRTILANGMKRYRLDLDPLGSAYLDAAIDSQVGLAIRAPRFDSPDGTGDGCGGDHEQLPDPRTLTQIAADAVVEIARHAIACDNTKVPLPAATIVVRMTLEALLTGLGEAQIDGIEQPISAGTARRMAADAAIIPAVLGGPSEILDFGASRRLFSRAQRIALAERDGGCAVTNCARPPSHTEAHHIRWWSHTKETNLANGILLCTKHHHTVHRDGWGIEVIDNVPWFIPPSSVDAYRRPRRGGRAPAPTVPPGDGSSFDSSFDSS